MPFEVVQSNLAGISTYKQPEKTLLVFWRSSVQRKDQWDKDTRLTLWCCNYWRYLTRKQFWAEFPATWKGRGLFWQDSFCPDTWFCASPWSLRREYRPACPCWCMVGTWWADQSGQWTELALRSHLGPARDGLSSTPLWTRPPDSDWLLRQSTLTSHCRI